MTTVAAEARRAAEAVDDDRLWRRLQALARFGATPAGGVCRLALSAEEIGARRQIIDWAQADGLSVGADAAGNLFVELSGEEPALPPVLTGSHIDSQPTGGRFDGAYGVLAGLEALAAIARTGVRPPRSIVLAAWMNEEASRFSPGMMGSKAFAGEWALDEIRQVQDADGVSVGTALDALRSAEPDVPERPLGFPVAAFVEAHIEQAPVLDRAGVPVGIVTGIQGTSRYRITVAGSAGHAGTVPQDQRRDAMMAAARIIAALDREALALPGMMLTVGMLRLQPNAPSVIPREAYFSVDVRHVDDAALESIDRRMVEVAAAEAGPCTVHVERIAHAPNLHFPQAMRRRIAAAADALGVVAIELPSAAGHDARHLHPVCPTGMIFIPCRDGISHAEDEYSRAEDVAAGARVLAHVLIDLAASPPQPGAR
ncbi:MAG: M20 family metallo-hydrolase [Alphaproteobacteria bacterium]